MVLTFASQTSADSGKEKALGLSRCVDVMTKSYQELIDRAEKYNDAQARGHESVADDSEIWVKFNAVQTHIVHSGTVIREFGQGGDASGLHLAFEIEASSLEAPFSPYPQSRAQSPISFAPSPASSSSSPRILPATASPVFHRSLSREGRGAHPVEGHIWVMVKNEKWDRYEDSCHILHKGKNKKALICNTYDDKAEICCDFDDLEATPDYLKMSGTSLEGLTEDDVQKQNMIVGRFLRQIESDGVFPGGPFRKGEVIKFRQGGRDINMNLVGSGTSTVVFQFDRIEPIKDFADDEIVLRKGFAQVSYQTNLSKKPKAGKIVLLSSISS